MKVSAILNGLALLAAVLVLPARAGSYPVGISDVRDRVALTVRDVGVIVLEGVSGVVDSGDVVEPMAMVMNFGDEDETFPTILTIGTEYTEIIETTVPPGGIVSLPYPPWTANVVGTFPVRCSTALEDDEDPGNDFMDDTLTVLPPSGVAEPGGRAGAFFLLSPTPNPVRREASIRFGLARAGRATLAVYSLAGTLVRTVVERDLPAGVHRAAWDGRDRDGRAAGAGVYLVRLEAGGRSATSKLVYER